MRWILFLSLAAALNLPAWSSPTEEEPLTGLTERGLVSQIGTQLSAVKNKAGDQAAGMVEQAMGLLGVPYRRGGANENTGFDCSGFVRHLYEQSIGLVLPRRADEQAKATQSIDRNELKPGDLVFFNTMRRTFSHVGIYVGEGKFIHSPHTGSSVRVDDMRAAYWNKRFTGARRVEPGDNESH